ncbi:MAG: SusD/RagB family nutrient-binding outer membrane lipoprotein [Gemmatimonadota bacterium]
MRASWKRTARALALAVLVSGTAACDWLISPTESNPNVVADATLDQLFVSVQLNAWFIAEGDLSRFAAVWLQQMAGMQDRQFGLIHSYDIVEDDGGDAFNTTYTGGGLVDIVRAIDLATERPEAAGRVYAGILKVHQAFMIGTIASVHGDVPFSEAVNPEIAEPALDDQAAVYAAVQALLDEAIADLQSGEGAGPGAIDFSFGGNAAQWVAVANTLKARFHAHWMETDPGRAAQVLAAANSGIRTAAGNWRALHSTTATEQNLWNQFMGDRPNYIQAGAFLVDLLLARDDPRVAKYYEPNADGEFVGSPVNEEDVTASNLALCAGCAGAQDFGFVLASCEENAGLAAEAAFRQGGAAAAQPWIDELIQCSSTFWGVDVPPAQQPLTLEEIILQKYMALFLSHEIWSDYKRTCFPAVETFAGREIPRRLYYPFAERQANTNVPEPAEQDAQPFNDNDPNPCP